MFVIKMCILLTHLFCGETRKQYENTDNQLYALNLEKISQVIALDFLKFHLDPEMIRHKSKLNIMKLLKNQKINTLSRSFSLINIFSNLSFFEKILATNNFFCKNYSSNYNQKHEKNFQKIINLETKDLKQNKNKERNHKSYSKFECGNKEINKNNYKQGLSKMCHNSTNMFKSSNTTLKPYTFSDSCFFCRWNNIDRNKHMNLTFYDKSGFKMPLFKFRNYYSPPNLNFNRNSRKIIPRFFMKNLFYKETAGMQNQKESQDIKKKAWIRPLSYEWLRFLTFLNPKIQIRKKKSFFVCKVIMMRSKYLESLRHFLNLLKYPYHKTVYKKCRNYNLEVIERSILLTKIQIIGYIRKNYNLRSKIIFMRDKLMYDCLQKFLNFRINLLRKNIEKNLERFIFAIQNIFSSDYFIDQNNIFQQIKSILSDYTNKSPIFSQINFKVNTKLNKKINNLIKSLDRILILNVYFFKVDILNYIQALFDNQIACTRYLLEYMDCIIIMCINEQINKSKSMINSQICRN